MRDQLLGGIMPLALLLGTANATVSAPPAGDRTAIVRAHTTFLAADLLEGRATGTRGYALAAHYVATQFALFGLEPGGDAGAFRQPVKFLEVTTDHDRATFTIHHGTQTDALTPLNDMQVSTVGGAPDVEVTAPLVFVGYGVDAPELGYSDFGPVDLTGKIAVVLNGAPEIFPPDYRAHYSTNDEKRPALARRGAIGMISISAPPEAARRPWSITAAQARRPQLRLLDVQDAPIDLPPGWQVTASVNPASAARLFVAAPQSLEASYAAAARSEPQAFPLNISATLRAQAHVQPVACANVLGWLPGTDPALAAQPVVVTAHLDHLGVGPAIDGDTIFNGAMDNAIGTAVLLAIAENLAAAPRSRRPVLFAALTAEEKGLLGARHLASTPPRGITRFAANLNFDMPLFVRPVRTVVAWGAEHSTLGALAATAAARTGFTIVPDFMPQERIFVRSDQYAFIRRGVPALMLGTGQQGVDPADDLRGAWETFLKERYHKRNDDLAQPIDWPSAGAYASFATELVRLTADAAGTPAWLPGDFFGERFGPR